MNQQAYIIAISCACLLMCYYLYREINKAKADITNLKDFSGNVSAFLERAGDARKPDEEPQDQPEKTEEASEAKKED